MFFLLFNMNIKEARKKNLLLADIVVFEASTLPLQFFLNYIYATHWLNIKIFNTCLYINKLYFLFCGESLWEIFFYPGSDIKKQNNETIILVSSPLTDKCLFWFADLQEYFAFPLVKRPVYIFAFGVYNSKHVNVSDIQHYLPQM